MKIRNGFVSNSSSSSFIVNLNSYNNSTLKLAEAMIPNSYKPELFMENLKKLKDKTCNLLFGTTNYDTYITYLDENYALVETCNNEDWDYIDKKYDIDYDKYHIDNEYSCEYKLKDEYETKPVYVSLFDSRIKGKKSSKYKSCKKCYLEMLEMGKYIVCPNCGCDENGKQLKFLLREDKINKINKD